MQVTQTRRPTKEQFDAFRLATSPSIRRRSLVVALVVGTVLTLINQGDALLQGHDLNWLKAALTYAVPYCVATYGAYAAARSRHKEHLE